MRAILDTNILVSALISTGGRRARLVGAWLSNEFVLVSHARQLDQLREVTRREKLRPLIRPALAGRLVNRIMERAEMSDAIPSAERSRDPNDDFLLALCEAGRADVSSPATSPIFSRSAVMARPASSRRPISPWSWGWRKSLSPCGRGLRRLGLRSSRAPSRSWERGSGRGCDRALAVRALTLIQPSLSGEPPSCGILLPSREKGTT